ncbi:MAG: hypothetical protein PUF37_04310 [Prevotellaceae bacterium]|nr:hypothetical protein [Prevotellaceae bacterium]
MRNCYLFYRFEEFPGRALLGFFFLVFFFHSTRCQTISQRYAWRGFVGKAAQVEVVLEVRTDGLAAGTVSYLNASAKRPLMLIGKVNQGVICLTEFLNDGTQKGNWVLHVKSGVATGVWNAMRTDTRKLTITLTKRVAVPASFKSLLVPESPDSIGRKYSYITPAEKTGQDPFGGTFTFRGAGKNKIAFNCDVYMGNIASGESEKGRPVILKGNKFTYIYSDERDECGCCYTFKGEFFKRFLYTRDVVNNDYCFGYGASFAGIFIKISQ